MENKNMMDALEEYTQKVFSGEIVAGSEIKRMLSILQDDRKSNKYIFDTTNADMRMAFMESFCRQSKKPFFNKPITLMLWQKAFFTALYSFYRRNDDGTKGALRFQKAMLLIGRKNGKSTMAASDGFTELAIGSGGEDIVCGSNDDKQASLIWKEVAGMAKRIEKRPKRFHCNLSEVRNNQNDNKCFKMSGRTRDKDGRNIDKAFLDEVHNAIDDELYMAVWQSMSIKDDPMLLILTTEGYVNDGLLDKELLEIRAMLSGEIELDSYLAFLYTQDSENEIWQDESSWVKSNPSLGTVKKWDFLRSQVASAKRSKEKRIHVLCKDFNIHQNSAQAWLMFEDYTYPATFNLEDLRGGYAIGGVDLSATTDMTAACALIINPSTQEVRCISHYWIPERKLTDSDDKKAGAQYEQWARDGLLTIEQGNEVDIDKVAEWYYNLHEKYGITLYKCGYDVRLSKVFVKRMNELFGGECLEVIPQASKYLSEPMKLLEADLKGRKFNYNENAVDRWCFSNAQIKVNELGQCMIIKIKEQASRRIDGAVSKIIAYATWRMYRTEYLELYK